MLDYIKERPMLLCGLFGTALCIIGFYSRRIVFVSGIILILLFFLCLQKKVQRKFTAVTAVLFVISVSILTTCEKIDNTAINAGKEIRENFIVTDEPLNHGEFYTFTLESLNSKQIKSGTKISAYGENCDFGMGDIISANLKLKEIKSEYKANDYSNGLYITASAKNITVSKVGGDFVLHKTGKLRSYIRNTLFSNMGYNEAATLTAVLLGDTSYLFDRFYTNSKAAGVTHILVVSGMHLTVIVSLILFLVEKLIYNRYLKAFIMILTVLFVLTLCGFTKSILRAGLCCLLVSLGVIFGRENTAENTLGGAVIIILILNPFSIFSIAFQLSVLSTLGIVAAAVPVIRYIKNGDFLKYRLSLAVVTSVAVTVFAVLFTLPVTVYVFGFVSTLSVISNLLISYAVTVALSSAAIGLLTFKAIPILGSMILRFSSLITKYINFVINQLGTLPFATVNLGKTSFFLSLILLFAVIGALFACKRKNDMLKLKQMNEKIIAEGGKRLKWQ